MRALSVVACFAVVLAACVGCSQQSSIEGVVPASGKILQNGQPLEGATVTFAPKAQTQGRAASGTTDANGVFKLTTLQPGDGALPGEYQVTVTKVEVLGQAMSQDEANAYYNKYKKAPPAPKSKSLVADKYGRTSTSGLQATVKKGEKNDNFEFKVD